MDFFSFPERCSDKLLRKMHWSHRMENKVSNKYLTNEYHRGPLK